MPGINTIRPVINTGSLVLPDPPCSVIPRTIHTPCVSLDMNSFFLSLKIIIKLLFVRTVIVKLDSHIFRVCPFLFDVFDLTTLGYICVMHPPVDVAPVQYEVVIDMLSP